MEDTLATRTGTTDSVHKPDHGPGQTLDDLVRIAREITGVDLDARRDRLREAMVREASARGHSGSHLSLDHDQIYPVVEHLAGEATVKETYFFRSPEQFELLIDALLPGLRETALLRHDSWTDAPSLRLWSAGCSTGEEAYSLAAAVLMALRRTTGWDIEVLATDICESAIETGRAGRYDVHAVERRCAGSWDDRLGEWFEPLPGGGCRVRAPLTRLVRFERHNLLRDPLPEDVDVIFCRNVMVYFDAPRQGLLVDRLWEALRPGGLLFLGDAELLHVLPHRFESVPGHEAVVYRKPLVAS